MTFNVSIEINDKATPALQAKVAKCSPARINASVAHSAVRLTKLHLLALPHNKRDWAPQNFYKKAAAATISTILPEGVLISIPQIGMRQRYYGGTIKPVNAKALAIPVAEEAYGKVPADFGGQLQLIVIKGKGAWLALKSFETVSREVGPRVKSKRQGPAQGTTRERLKFLFRLSYGLEQQGDKSILPTDEAYADDGIQAMEEAIK